MQYVACAITTVLLLYALGIGLTLLLLPRDAQEYSLIIAPWVGYCYATLASWLTYYFGGRLNWLALTFILLPPIGCLTALLLGKGRAVFFHGKWATKPLLISLLGFLALSLTPLLAHEGLATFSLLNYDAALYGAVSRFLSEFGRGSITSFGRFDAWVAKEYFGPPAFAALAGAGFGVMPHQTITLCANLFCALGAATVFLLLRDALAMPVTVSLLGTAFLVFHPALHYVAMQNFFGQAAGMPLAALLFWANSRLLRPDTTPGDRIRVLLLLSCFTSGLLLTYSFMLLFVWFLCFAYAAGVAWCRKEWSLLATCLIAHLVACVTAGALCPLKASTFIGFLKYNANVDAGWFIPFFAPDYLFGLSWQNAPFETVGPLIHAVLVTIATAFLLFLLGSSYKAAKQTTILLWMCCTLLYVGCVILALGDRGGKFGGYKSFKLATFFLPFFAAGFASLFDGRAAGSRRLTRALTLIAVIAIACAYVNGDARLFLAMRKQGTRTDSQYQALLAVDRDEKIESVNIRGQNGWDVMWEAYFLMHKKKIYMEARSYYQPSELNGTYDLCDSASSGPCRQAGPEGVPAVRQLNNRFSLVGPINH